MFEIGNSLREARLRRGVDFAQAELAELIGKSQSAISQIEHGEIGLSLELLRAIVAQLGGEVEIAAVFDGTWRARIWRYSSTDAVCIARAAHCPAT